MPLLCIFKKIPKDQICAKTLKSETPNFLFSRTHARGLLMDHSTRFFPLIFNLVKKSSLRSLDNILQLLLLSHSLLLTSTHTDSPTNRPIQIFHPTPFCVYPIVCFILLIIFTMLIRFFSTNIFLLSLL